MTKNFFDNEKKIFNSDKLLFWQPKFFLTTTNKIFDYDKISLIRTNTFLTMAKNFLAIRGIFFDDGIGAKE